MYWILGIILLLLVVAVFYKVVKQNNEAVESEGEEPVEDKSPRIMGLGLGYSFDLDPLMLKLSDGKLVTKSAAPSHIILAAGVVDWDGAKVFRFYTDDDAWLQVLADGGTTEDHVTDVKIMHYFDTLDVGSQEQWDDLLHRKVGAKTWNLEVDGETITYHRVWTSATDYHQPVPMIESTYDNEGGVSHTDQFVMLFERDLGNDLVESLFVSAEEKETSAGQLERCLVLSTGVTLTSAQITIHG